MYKNKENNFTGLTDEEVKQSREEHGSNKLPDPELTKWWEFALDTLKEPITVILIVITIITLILSILGVEHISGPILTLIVIGLVTGIAVKTNTAIQKSSENLRRKTATRYCEVIRDGEVKTINADDLVVGDITMVTLGQEIHADGYLIDGKISVSNAAINGEAEECKKTVIPGYVYEKDESTDAYKNQNHLFAGTVVVAGEGLEKVTVVGKDTVNGETLINMQTLEAPKTALDIALGQLANFINKWGTIAAIIAFVTMTVSGIMQIGLAQYFSGNVLEVINRIAANVSNAATIIVAAVPEGLPLIVKLVTKQNVSTMEKFNILAKNPNKIPELAYVNLICTDKTGTLTTGVMSPEVIVDGEGNEVRDNSDLAKTLHESIVLNNSSFYNEEHKIVGNNFIDRAILSLVVPKESEMINEKYSVERKQAFSSELKYSVAYCSKISCELSTEGTEVPCFTSVENSNGKVTNMISKKSIQQLFPEISIIHDKLLENTNTGCEALLMGESGYAIVGTKVIVSDDLIVHDAGDDVYYNLELITSLLTNSYLKELDKKIGNQITSLYISDSNLNESRYKVYSDSTLLNKTDVIQLKVKNANGTEKSTKFYNMDSMNRGMNSASRTFKIKDSQGRDASITVVVDLDFVVPSGTAFADSKLSTNLLNGPLTANNISATYFSRPSDSEPDLQNWWDSNLGCSNALYNFLYGTNGIVYVESGYLAPSLTILRSSDAITDKQVSQVFKNFKLYDINGISYKKFFGSDLDKFWEFYYDANANTGLTNLSKTLAKESRSFQQITGTSSTSGINYQGKFFVTNANTIYRSLDNADDVITKNLKVNHGSKRIDLTTQTQGENSVSPQTGDKIQYEYTDNNKNKKTTTWTYCGIEDGYYVLEPDIDLMKNASSDWKKGTPVLQTAGGSSYTINTLATDNTIQYYLKQFYMVGFPDIWDKIDVSSYTSKTASSKLWKANATMFGDNGFSQGRDQQYYLSGGKVYSRQIISKDGKRVNTLAEVSRPSDDMNVAAIPVAYVPTGDISITSSTSGNNVVFKATAGYKGTALHYGNVFLKNINQSVIDYSVYKSMKTKKINELNDNDTIYIGTTLFCKKGDYFVSSPITNDQLVATAKAAGTTSIKGQAVGIFMGLKVRVDGSERNLSEYVIDADTGTLYNEGNGEDGIVYKQGGTVNVWKDNKAQGTEVSAKQICIKVKFDDNLLCRSINDKGNAYTLLYANTYLGSESLGNLPFLSEKLDYNRFSNVNATLSMSKFNLSEFAKVAKKEFLKRFRDRFFDDSRGLIYNIILALASYLTVMSWLVYGVLRYGIGRHLLEMIANPTRMQSFRGIDLIKVFTFGIYSLDTEPTLARFFTTSLINVAIIYVVVFVLPH